MRVAISADTRRSLLGHGLWVLLGALFLNSCGLISEAGPLKRTISSGSATYNLVEVKSVADIPGNLRTYGVGTVPPQNKGEPYSDAIRERDSLNFVITDLVEESPFFSKGDPFRFGPVEVPSDGQIDIPYVGTIGVIGKSLSQVSTELGDKVIPVSKTARSAVFRSDRISRFAHVIGEVKNPGPVPLERAEMTSVDILSVSGGPDDSEHLFKYILRRQNTDYVMDYLAFRQKPFPIEEGDLLTVTSDTSNRFHVMGAINRPTTVAFPVPSPTLVDALSSATGLDETRSDPSGVFVFRRGSPDMVYTFNLKESSSIHLIQRFPIQGNDLVYVTEAPLARWNRLITQVLPISISQAANSAARFTLNN